MVYAGCEPVGMASPNSPETWRDDVNGKCHGGVTSLGDGLRKKHGGYINLEFSAQREIAYDLPVGAPYYPYLGWFFFAGFIGYSTFISDPPNLRHFFF
jgi:hypothetical protein